MSKISKYLSIVVIVETIVIVGLVGFDKRVVIVRSEPVPAPYNPLKLAIEYQSPDHKFEQLVKQYPYLLSYHGNTKGAANSPILADCAILNLTNYVRILLINGADVGGAIKSLQKTGSADAIKLIQDVKAGL